jgi:hypothetical protein
MRIVIPRVGGDGFGKGVGGGLVLSGGERLGALGVIVGGLQRGLQGGLQEEEHRRDSHHTSNSRS